MYKLLVVAALMAIAAAERAPYARPSYQEPAYNDHPSYSYEYAVKDDYSGNDYAAQETRDGYNTQGSYRVLLPDGRVQTVTYTVNGDSGYIADVSYSGEPRYDNYKPAASYKRPIYVAAPTYAPAPYKPAPAYAPRRY